MSEKPNPCSLKMVMLFDPRDESCCICSHNLSPEDASQELEELRDEGLFAFTVHQSSHHAADDPDDCTACRADLADVTQDMPCRARKPASLKRQR